VPTTTDTPKVHREVWTYTGRRLSWKGKLAYVWQDEHGDTHLFPKQLGRVHPGIGASYSLAIDDDRATVWTGSDYTPERVDRPGWVTEDQIVQWDLQDEATMTERNRAATERKLNEALPSLHEALLPVKRVYHESRDRHAKAAVLAAVIAEINRW
jgi:hypothetical protein